MSNIRSRRSGLLERLISRTGRITLGTNSAYFPGRAPLSRLNNPVRRYYQAYVAFWSKALLSTSIQQVFEEYVISRDANIVPGKDGKPLMLSRFLGGFLHPLIHCGNGAEFGLPGLVAEGAPRAWTCLYGSLANVARCAWQGLPKLQSKLLKRFPSFRTRSSKTSQRSAVEMVPLCRLVAEPHASPPSHPTSCRSEHLRSPFTNPLLLSRMRWTSFSVWRMILTSHAKPSGCLFPKERTRENWSAPSGWAERSLSA